MKIESSVEIERPLTEVFEFVTDHERMPLWLSTLQSSVPQDGKGNTPGAAFEQVHLEAGKEVRFSGEVDAWDAPREARLKLSNDDATVLVTYTFEETTQGTRFAQTSEVDLHNFMLKLAAPAFRGTVESRLEEDFARLKSLLEEKA